MLMLRIANTRHNFLSDALAKVWFMANLREQALGGGPRGRRSYRLKLLRDENPVFALSWTLYHVIDDTSPLQGLTAEDFAALDAGLAVILTGYDENYAQEVRARHLYHYDDFRRDHDYVDVIEETAPGIVEVDYSRFHETRPIDRTPPIAPTNQG